MAFPFLPLLLAGAVGGGLGRALGPRRPGAKGNFLTGYYSDTEQLPLYTQQQQQALRQLLSQGLGNLDFGPIAQQARTNFQEETIPGIAERFTALGGSGQRSSGFQSALGRAGSDLESSLAALRSQYGLQQLGLGLNRQFENVYNPATSGLLGGLGSSAAQSAGQLGGLYGLSKLGLFR